MPSAHIAPPGRMNTPARSSGSYAFESLWRSIPRSGAVPARSDFNPALAAETLRNILLVEGPTASRPGVYLRLVGDALNANVQHNMTGQNWLDFLPAQYHAAALATARLIWEHPCGIWQLTPLHYERGYSQLLEVTIFPLRPAPDGTPLMLAHIEFHAWSRWQRIARGSVLSVETAVDFAFINIGAGVPEWTEERSEAIFGGAGQ